MFPEYHEEKVKAILVWMWHSAGVACTEHIVSVKKHPKQQGKLSHNSLCKFLLTQPLLCTAVESAWSLGGGCLTRCPLAAMQSCSWSCCDGRSTSLLQMSRSDLGVMQSRHCLHWLNWTGEVRITVIQGGLLSVMQTVVCDQRPEKRQN